jgi:CRP-like cAMP-binding protein
MGSNYVKPVELPPEVAAAVAPVSLDGPISANATTFSAVGTTAVAKGKLDGLLRNASSGYGAKRRAGSPAAAARAPKHTASSGVPAALLYKVKARPWAKVVLHFIVRGRVDVLLRDPGAGRVVISRGPGDVVGVEALLGADARPFVGVCRDEVLAYEITVADFSAVVGALQQQQVSAALHTSSSFSAQASMGTFRSLVSETMVREKPRAPAPAPAARHDEHGHAAPAPDAERNPASRALLGDVLLSLCEERRRLVMSGQPITAPFLRGSSAFLADWSDAGLADLIARMEPLSFAKGVAMPLGVPDVVRLIAEKRSSAAVSSGSASPVPMSPRGKKKGQPQEAPPPPPGKPQQVAYFVLHGTMQVLPAAGGVELVKPGHAYGVAQCLFDTEEPSHGHHGNAHGHSHGHGHRQPGESGGGGAGGNATGGASAGAGAGAAGGASSVRRKSINMFKKAKGAATVLSPAKGGAAPGEALQTSATPSHASKHHGHGHHHHAARAASATAATQCDVWVLLQPDLEQMAAHEHTVTLLPAFQAVLHAT